MIDFNDIVEKVRYKKNWIIECGVVGPMIHNQFTSNDDVAFHFSENGRLESMQILHGGKGYDIVYATQAALQLLAGMDDLYKHPNRVMEYLKTAETIAAALEEK